MRKGGITVYIRSDYIYTVSQCNIDIDYRYKGILRRSMYCVVKSSIVNLL